LGHQILALLFEGSVGKLQFGHHAINHPVKVVRDTKGNTVQERVWITSQNHNYHVIENSIAKNFVVTHVHGNDATVAGMRHRWLPVFSVQFHPESNPGPHDATLLFRDFANLMEDFHASTN
jgi:carbamoyl-phosphate synthase small subunit